MSVEVVLAVLCGLISLMYASKKRENGYLLGFYHVQLLSSAIFNLNHISDSTVEVNKLFYRKINYIFPQSY